MLKNAEPALPRYDKMSLMPEPTPELIDAIYCDKLRQVDMSTPEERFLDGPRLFDFASEFSMAGIRWENPGIAPDEVLQKLRERIAIVRRAEEGR